MTWNCEATVEATITYTTVVKVTHHIPAVCSVGIFGDVTVREYSGYIYDNYTNALLSTYKGTLRTVTGRYYDGIYHVKIVKKFYNKDYTINKTVDN